MAGPGDIPSTIEDVLDGQVDVFSLAFASNLDAVGESAERAVSPAGSTVLGDVLIQTVGHTGLPLVVVPGKTLGKGLTSHICVRKR